MSIKFVNGYMAKALKTEKKKGTDVLQNIDPDKYNGVHVDPVKPERRALLKYLIKYVGKNEIEFYRLPWHCSHNISRLFTSEFFEVRQFDECTKNLPKGTDEFETNYNFYESEYHETVGFKFNPDEANFENLDTTNKIIYNSINV